MQRIAVGLSALLFTAVSSNWAVAQRSPAVGGAAASTQCIERAADDLARFECGGSGEPQARDVSGSRPLVETQATVSTPATPPSLAGRAPHAPGQPTWREDPSLMDSSWRR
jgi:hypothetical protein